MLAHLPLPYSAAAFPHVDRSVVALEVIHISEAVVVVIWELQELGEQGT